MLYIPQYWWHIVRSHDAPNIGLNVWFAMFNFEEQFREAGISEDTDVTKVTKPRVDRDRDRDRGDHCYH